jgi:UDP-glucose 4-epimerase
MKILVTGGAGFIGSHIVEHYHKAAEIIVMDDLRTGHRRNLSGFDVNIVEASICDRLAVKSVMKNVDVVFHMAAMVSVPESVHFPIRCAETNVIGLLNVLEEAASAGVRKFCFCSSAAVYGNNPVVPKSEDMLPEPRSPYAVTKLDGEYYCQQFLENRGLETVALRFFNVFGPRQDPKGAYAAAVPIFFEHALAGTPITIYGDGNQTRDFIFVKDVVGALSFMASTPGITGVHNTGYGTQITVLELAKQIISLTNSKSQIQFAPERLGDVRHSRACISRLCKAGFKPRGTLELGLRQMLSAFQRPADAAQ